MIRFIHNSSAEKDTKNSLQEEECAFSELYNKYFNPLYDYGRRIYDDSELVKDSIQDLFVKIWSNRREIFISNSLKAYLYVALRNIIINKITQKKNRKKREYSISQNLHFRMEYPAEDFSSKELKDGIPHWLESFQHLTPRQKECIYLRFYSGLEFEEIAQVMNISTKAVYKLKGRSLVTLKRYLDKAALLCVSGFVLFLFL